jgi:hypothetical protein
VLFGRRLRRGEHLPGRNVRGVWRRRTAVLRRRLFRSARVHGRHVCCGACLWRERPALLRGWLVRFRSRVLGRALRALRCSGPAVLRRRRVQQRLRVLHGGVHLRPRRPTVLLRHGLRPGHRMSVGYLSHVRRTGAAVLRRRRMHGLLELLGRNVRAVRLPRGSVLPGQSLRHGHDTLQRVRSVHVPHARSDVHRNHDVLPRRNVHVGHVPVAERARNVRLP